MLGGASRDGLEFTQQLLEALVDVHDPFSAAVGLRAASQDLPDSLPARDRLAMRAGGLASLGMPWAVLPAARRLLRERVGHLVLATKLPAGGEKSALPSAMREAFAGHTRLGCATVLALDGAAVLGPTGVEREVERLSALTELPEVTHLAIDPTRLAPAVLHDGLWALDTDADSVATALRPICERAARNGVEITLAASDLRGTLLGAEALLRLVSEPDPAGEEPGEPPLVRLRIGARLPADLPESHELAQRLIAESQQRVAGGGEPIELLIGVAGLARGEQIASLLSGLPVPTSEGQEAAHAQLLRLIDLVASSTGGQTGHAVRLAVASEHPLLLAAATLRAEAAGLPLTVQMRAGTADALAAALVAHDHRVRLHLPIMLPKEFAGAVDMLIGLAAEGLEPGGALRRAAGFAGADATATAAASAEGGGLQLGTAELRRALALADEPFPTSHRTQRRAMEWHPSVRDSALFYRPPADPDRFDTGGLTAAVLSLSRDDTGQLVLDATGPIAQVPAVAASGFANEPDTDASRIENREWARDMLRRGAGEGGPATAEPEAAGRDAGADLDSADLDGAEADGADLDGAETDSAETDSAEVDIANLDSAALDDEALNDAALDGAALKTAVNLDAVLAGAAPWCAQRPGDRATRVARLALGVASARDRLIGVLAAETGAPIAQIDAEISGAIDAARYAGQLGSGLGAVRGAEFTSDGLTVVVAEAGVSLAERAEAVLSALAAGSAVVCVVHPTIARSSAALIEEWEAAGLPPGTVVVVSEERGGVGRAGGLAGPAGVAAEIAADHRVARAIVLGSRDTARAITRRRPDVRIEGRFRALGSMLICPSAELPTAVRDAVRSAFVGGPAEPRSARMLVLLGSTGRSKQLRRLLVDAVRGLRVGDTADASLERDPLGFDIGPLTEAPSAAGLRALTELQSGEQWLVEPKQLDRAGRLWRPGVRWGVRRDSSFWRDALGMPVIGVITANSLAEAIELQSSIGGGGSAGVCAADPAETLPWLELMHAASLSVNRPTTGARIERHPGGAWGRDGVGTAPLAGGPHRLVALGSWRLREGTPSSTLHLRGLAPEVRALIEVAQSSLDYASFDRVRRAALADALTWRTTLGRVHDEIGLRVELNLLRHWPVSTHVRLAEEGSLADLVRVLAASLIVQAPTTVSTGAVLPPEIMHCLAELGIAVSLERDEAWLERIAAASLAQPGAEPLAERVRLIGGDPVRAAEWLGGRDRVALIADPVTMAGPVELLAFLREQSISITAHRHGLVTLPEGVEAWAAEIDARVREV